MTIVRPQKLFIRLWMLVLAFCSLGLPLNTSFGQETPVPTSQIQSLFTGDSCAPPCWFGITPGLTTAEEMETLFSHYSETILVSGRTSEFNEFNPTTGYLENGEYAIYYINIAETDRIDLRRVFINGGISLQHGIVTGFKVLPVRTIMLGELIDKLGQPDIIYLTMYQGGILEMDATFWEVQVRVRLLDLQFWTGQPCSIEDIRDGFYVDNLEYFSQEEASFPATRSGRYPDVRIYPALATPVSYARIIPNETWQAWLAGSVESDCYRAYEQLPLPEDFPVPTLPPSYESFMPLATQRSALLDATQRP